MRGNAPFSGLVYFEEEGEKGMLVIIYAVLGYWATGRTIYRNKILIGTSHGIFMERFVTGVVLGWALIPIAIIRLILGI